MEKDNIFLELIEYQKSLDSKMTTVREKDEIDVRLAMAAEAIEANEEMGIESYKTWKSKNVDIDKLKEEVVDVLFFILQYHIRFANDIDYRELGVIHEIDKTIILPIGKKKQLFRLLNEINRTDEFSLTSIYREFWILCSCELEMTKEEVKDVYVKKYNKNLLRIGGGGGSKWL